MTDSNPVIEAAKEYALHSATYKSMKEIGKEFGVSSHVIGKKLKEIGLRTPDGKPTQQANEGGFVKTAEVREGLYFDVWHSERTLHVLRPLIKSTKK